MNKNIPHDVPHEYQTLADDLYDIVSEQRTKYDVKYADDMDNIVKFLEHGMKSQAVIVIDRILNNSRKMNMYHYLDEPREFLATLKETIESLPYYEVRYEDVIGRKNVVLLAIAAIILLAILILT